MRVPVRTSEIKSYLRCRLSWFWSAPRPRGWYLEPAVPRAALHQGRIVHKALQIGYDTGEPFADAYRTISAEALEGREPYDGELDQIKLGTVMMQGYQSWAAQADEKVKFLATEMKLSGKIGSYPARWRFDAVIERGDGLWVLDFKTTSSRETPWTTADLQATSYVYAARQLIDPRIRGLLFRFLLKKAPMTYKDGLILKNGSVTQRDLAGGITTLEEYSLALAVATLKSLHESGDVDLGFEDPFAGPGLEIYSAFLDGTQQEKPWYPSFKEAYTQARRLYHDKIQELKGPSRFFWEVEEYRTEEQIRRTLKYVLEPAVKRMVSRRKDRWIGPTGLGAAFSVCRSCQFKDPCRLAMQGADYKTILRENYRTRTEDEYDS